MAKLFELRPQKDLLDPTFEGYKLSLDPLPVYKHDLPVGIEHLRPNDQQFSFQHVKTFGLHNHLIDDPWEDDCAYFISKDFQIFQIDIHSLASQSPQFQSVWKIPKSCENLDGWFNTSLSFAGPKLAVASDGGGTLHILDTGSRNTHDFPWQLKLSHQLSGSEPFKIVHSFFNEDPHIKTDVLTVLLLKVTAIDQVESHVALSMFGCSEKETPFITCLDWLEFRHQDDKWSFENLKRLAIPHGIDYASLLAPGKSICLITREPFGIVYDSSKNLAKETPSSQLLTEKDQVAYTWTETEEDVIVWMSFANRTSKHDLVVNIERQHLKVIHQNDICLTGALQHSVSVDSSTWTLADGKLEIVLAKTDKSYRWEHLILQDDRGRKVDDRQSADEWHHRLIRMSPEEMQQENVLNQPQIFSSEQLEECDDVPLDDTFLFRFDGESNLATHKAMLSGYQLLFITRSVPTMSPSFCLRHDVDGLVWQPMADESEQPWGCLHTAALQAIGYIQASKEQRKFTVAPPNMSYVALCDAFQHVYIYRQPNSSTGVDLIHRPTGRKTKIARQQVLNIDTAEECLGAMATNTFLLIVTSSSLFCVRINSD